MRKRTYWIVGGVVGVLVATGAVAAVVIASVQPVPLEATVPTAIAKRADIVSTVRGKGALAAASTASASFTAGGTVTGISVALGQSVSAGQDLATIDPSAADRELEKARGAYAAADVAVDGARANATRARDALEAARIALTGAQQPVSPAPTEGAPDDSVARVASAQQTVRDAESALTGAETEVGNAARARDDASRDVAAAESARAQTTLKAPIAGVVTAINGTIGSVAPGGGSSQDSPGQPTNAGSAGFMQISDTSAWTVTVAVSELDVARVASGQTAIITLPGAENEEVAGEVTIVAPTPSASADGVVTYPVTVKLAAPPKSPRLGLTAFVRIVVGEAKDVLALPNEAISITGPQAGTARVQAKNGRVTVLEVTTGIVGDGMTEIRSGLKAGDKVEIEAPSDTSQPEGGGGDDLGFDSEMQ